MLGIRSSRSLDLRQPGLETLRGRLLGSQSADAATRSILERQVSSIMSKLTKPFQNDLFGLVGVA